MSGAQLTQDVNRTIDAGIERFAFVTNAMRDTILDAGLDREYRDQALGTLDAMQIAFNRMAALARLSVTPFDQERDV